MASEIIGLANLQKAVKENLIAYHNYLINDAAACDDECEYEYAQQRLNQADELYPVMSEVLKLLDSLTPFKE